jgi:predicted transcriptional regulator
VAEIAKGQRITGPDRDKLGAQLRKQYLAGASIRELAGQTGRSYGFVHRILVDSGVELRGRGGATAKRKAVAG